MAVAVTSFGQALQQRLSTVAVLHAGGGDQDADEQAHGVDGDVTLTSVDLLAGVVAAA
jgi:hypothetical protein